MTPAGALTRRLKGAAIAVLAGALLAPALPAGLAAAAPASASASAPTVAGGKSELHKVASKFAVFSLRNSKLPAHKAGTRDRILASDGTTASLVPDPPAAPKRSTWVVNYDSGFTTAANGPAAKVAFQAAVDIWARIVASPVPIVVNASFANLGGNTLGQASSAEGLWSPGIGDGHSAYPIALANELTGSDLDTAKPDIIAQFNSNPVAPFYYGTDGAPTSGTADFESVVLHELGHGLGFAGSMAMVSPATTVSYSNPPMKWDSFMQDGTSTPLVSYASGSAQLTSALQSQAVTWDGAQGVTANGGTPPKLYAPATWQQGSSGSHLDEATYPIGNANSLMTPSVAPQEAIHSPGPVAVAIMSDEGWNAAIPLPAVPDPPTTVSATRLPGAASVSWNASTDYGNPVTQYVATATPGGANCSTSGALGCTVSGLTNGSSYTFKVVARNVNGAGAASAASAPVVPADAPATPTAPTALPNNAGATVSWAAPSNNGDPISGYNVESSVDGQTWSAPLSSSVTSAATQAAFSGLSNGTSYVFRVAAINTAGTSGWSPASAAVTPVQTPDAPTGVQGTRDDTQVSVDWTPPAPNGGPAITGYRLEWSSNSGVTWSAALSTALTDTTTHAVVPNLTNGTAYVFHVAANNSLGTSRFSSPSSAVTPAGKPGTPTNVTGVPANGQVTLSWTAPSSNGDPITGYNVQYSTDNASWSAPLASAAGSAATAAVVSGLTNLQPYYFRVAATNTLGTGLFASPAGTITPAGTPSTPTNFTGTPGDAKALLRWTAPTSDGGSAVTSYQVRYSFDSGAHWNLFSPAAANTSLFTVTGLSNGSTYAFDVAATNANGTGTFSSTVFVTATPPPGAPTSVTTGAGNGQVTVSWVAPAANGGAAVTGYDVQWSSNGGTTWSAPWAPAQTSTVTGATVTGLTNGTHYVFEVAARNAAGPGAFSAVTPVVTPATVPSVPSAVSATSGDQSAFVSWTQSSDGGSPITSYDVQYSSDGGTSWTSAATAFPSSPALVTGLVNGASYLFEVAAFNTIGHSVYSATSTAAVIPSGKPGTPTAVSASAGNAQATVTWTAPSGNGSTITSYVVRYSSDNGGSWTTVPGTVTTSPLTVTSLTNGAHYLFTVAAHNTNGDGTASAPTDPVTPVAPATAPAAPTGVSGTPSDQSVSVSWTPGADGGSPVSSYLVRYSMDNGSWIPVAGTFPGSPATVSGLTNGHSYRFQVAATNTIGTSSYSAPSLAVTPSGLPGTPTAVSATAGDSQATVTWTAPSNNGAAITRYVVRYSSDNGGSWTTVPGTVTTSPLTVTGLTNGAHYLFTVTAHNANGDGTASAPTDPVTPLTVPGIPTSVLPGAGNAQVTVTWVAPASNGGAAVTGYDVQWSSNGGTTWSAPWAPAQTSTVTGATVTGLTNGTHYVFEVAARNVVGRGTFSPATSAVTPATVPAVPSSVSATAGDQSAFVSWTQSSDGGSPITSYDVQYSSDGGTSWTSAATAFPSSPALVTGLVNGASYLFEVAAFNTIGHSVYSAASTTAVIPSGKPGTPSAVSASAGNAQATVTWTAPSGNGSTITSYVVRYSSDNGGSWTTVPGTVTTSPLTVTGLTNGAHYLFTVAAHNTNGDGTASAPTDPVTPVAPATAPAAPTSVSGTPSDQSVSVSWTPGADGGSPVSSYLVQYSMDNGSWIPVAGTFPGSPATVTSLTNGHSYRFQVAATNGIGTSSYSAPSLAVTPSGLPGTPTDVSASVGEDQAVVSWTAPSNNGATISSYAVRYSIPGGTWHTATGPFTASPALVTGLDNGTTYVFDVTAHNANGDSTTSTPSAPVTTPTTPAAPVITSTSAGNAQVSLSWTTPANGGLDISGYTVEWSTAGGTWSAPLGSALSSTTTSATVTGLTNGVGYVFRVAANNDLGHGTFSDPSTTATPVAPLTKPGVPTGLSATARVRSAALTWVAPSDGGSPITGYRVQYSSDDGGSWAQVDAAHLSVTGSGATVTGLADGTRYLFEVAADNAVAPGDFSATSAPVTLPTSPGVVAVGSPTPGNSHVTLTWTPSATGGSAITGYDVEYSTTNGQSWTQYQPAATAVTTSAVVDQLTNGTAYAFRVAAINAVGTGAYSPATTPVTPATVPDAPASVGVTAADRQVTVSWTTPLNGGSGITSYTVRYALADGNPNPVWTTFAPATPITGSPAVVTGLSNGTAYMFEVAAANTMGPGAFSSASSAATPFPHTSAITAAAAKAISYGASVTMATTLTDTATNTVLATTAVSLMSRTSSSQPFTLVTSPTTNASGVASYVAKPGVTTTYEWQYAGAAGHAAATSTPWTVTVAQVVTVTQTVTSIVHGGLVKFYGVVSPNALNQYVYLEQKSGTAWKMLTVKAKVINQKMPNGKTMVGYLLVLKTAAKGTFTYRAYRPATTSNALGASASKVLKVI